MEIDPDMLVDMLEIGNNSIVMNGIYDFFVWYVQKVH